MVLPHQPHVFFGRIVQSKPARSSSLGRIVDHRNQTTVSALALPATGAHWYPTAPTRRGKFRRCRHTCTFSIRVRFALPEVPLRPSTSGAVSRLMAMP